MLLLDIPLLIRQLLPPHWRDALHTTVLRALLSPVVELYNGYLSFRESTKNEIAVNMQIAVINELIKKITNNTNSYVLDNNDGSFVINVPVRVERYLVSAGRPESRTWTKLGVDDPRLGTRLFFDRYRIAGTSFIVDYLEV